MLKLYRVHRPYMKTDKVFVLAGNKARAIKLCHERFGYASGTIALELDMTQTRILELQ